MLWPDPMRISFIAYQCLPFHADSLNERPLGGTETGVIRLAECLQAAGHEVAVFTSHQAPPKTGSNKVPEYFSLSQLSAKHECDVLVSVRSFMPLFSPLKAKIRFLWTGDAADQLATVGIGDKRVVNRTDRLLMVSNWQKESLCRNSGFPESKAAVIKNGVHLPFFEAKVERQRKRLIYSSTPFRGLSELEKVFPLLKKKHPEAELHVYSGYDVYRGDAAYDKGLEDEFRKQAARLQAIEGCKVWGNVAQKDLALAFMSASVLAYPCTFPETSCITALEAQAAGCVVVTSALAALPETVADRGILVGGTPGSNSYLESFLKALDLILSDDALFEKLHKRTIAAREDISWEKVAERFLVETQAIL